MRTRSSSPNFRPHPSSVSQHPGSSVSAWQPCLAPLPSFHKQSRSGLLPLLRRSPRRDWLFTVDWHLNGALMKLLKWNLILLNAAASLVAGRTPAARAAEASPPERSPVTTIEALVAEILASNPEL